MILSGDHVRILNNRFIQINLHLTLINFNDDSRFLKSGEKGTL